MDGSAERLRDLINMQKLFEIRDLKKHYPVSGGVLRRQVGSVKALDGIDFKVYEGEFVAIMGPSGSGKSTAMNLVGSLDVPTKGSIYLDDNDISTLGESELAQIRGKKIGFIFQSFNLIPNLTAKENGPLKEVTGFPKKSVTTPPKLVAS